MVHDMMGWFRERIKDGGIHAVRRVSHFGAAHSELQREGKDKNGSIKELAMDKVGNKQNKNNK